MGLFNPLLETSAGYLLCWLGKHNSIVPGFDVSSNWLLLECTSEYGYFIDKLKAIPATDVLMQLH
jgi:hypothetical protein